MKTEPPYISVPKAAEMLGCTDVWVIRMLKEGRLDGFRLSGRAWAVARASVQRNLKEYLERDPALSGRKRSKIG
jgi:excisionase family DNA binding protein